MAAVTDLAVTETLSVDILIFGSGDSPGGDRNAIASVDIFIIGSGESPDGDRNTHSRFFH